MATGKSKYEYTRRNEATEAKLSMRVVETRGACKNHRRCKNTNTTLGNGLCMNCWDRKVQYKSGIDEDNNG